MILKTKMYKHQRKAFDKLSKIKVGALYMEMGTGKTRTALELIKLRLDLNKVEHILWLCPCSVKKSLEKDLLKHCDDISKITICGIETLSSSIKTNFNLINLVSSKKVYLIVDESNLVKNHKAKRTKNIIGLAEYCTYKLILNGTPISRCEKDLYSQWLVLDYRILGYKSFWSFAYNHLEYHPLKRGKIVRCLNTSYLVRKIAPYTYQVKKDECLDLPIKTYQTYYYELTENQRYHYNEVADKLMLKLDEFEPHTIYRLFSGLQSVISGFYVWEEKDHLKKNAFFENPLSNPRIQLLLDIVRNIDTKVIIFCKYKQEIQDICELLGEKAVSFNGELSQKERQTNLEKFEKEAQYLVAIKTCAGYGLNLQFCNYVIYYNNDWDYATRAQSEDRVHRIGQTKNVHYIDICADETLDGRILDCLHNKEYLIDSFKDELSKQKDKKLLDVWINGKNKNGNRINLKSKFKEYEELKEG